MAAARFELDVDLRLPRGDRANDRAKRKLSEPPRVMLPVGLREAADGLWVTIWVCGGPPRRASGPAKASSSASAAFSSS